MSLLFTVTLMRVGFSQGNVEFEHLNRNNGLPTNTITSIVQDKYGMMWFGSHFGLIRYDGYEYKTFLHDFGDEKSLGSNFVESLSLTKEGDLLIAHMGFGFSILDLETETFKRYKHKENESNSLNNDNLLIIHSDKKGIIWIGTIYGLCRYNTYTSKFSHYRIENSQDSLNFENLISSIVEEENGNLLLLVGGNQVARFNTENYSYSFLDLPKLKHNHMRLRFGGAILKDKNGELWIGTEHEGLLRLNEKTGKVIHYTSENSSLKSNVIMNIIQDRNGTIWIGSDGGGLTEFIHSTGKFISHCYQPSEQYSLGSNAVISLYESQAGHLWLGTFATGLNVIKKHKKRFEYYTNDLKGNKSLSYKSVISFANAGDGKTWIGTDGGGLNLFDSKTKSFEHLANTNAKICSNIIKSMVTDNLGNLWMGTYAKGLCVANFKKNYYRQYLPDRKPNENTISKVNVWALANAKNGGIWIGELGGGLDYFDPLKKTFIHYRLENEILKKFTNPNFMCVMVDKEDHLWAATQTEGLVKLHSPERHVSIFTHKNGDPTSLPSNFVKTVMQDSKGQIWVGTQQGGLSKLRNADAKEFVNFSIEDGLPGSTVYGIVEDHHKNLWITTDNGLAMYNSNIGTFRKFDKSDGILSLEFSPNAIYKEQDGHILIGGSDGFNRFHPDSILYNSKEPRVYISGFRLFNKPIHANMKYNGKTYFTKPIYLLDTLVLNYTNYVFSIEFTAIDYTSPDKNEFGYRLEGLEEDWNYVSANKRVATYTNLSPGEYIFRVKACNNDGVWNEQGRSLVIIVLAPWWQTWWFRTLFVFVILGILFGIFYLRNRRTRKQNILLNKSVRVKTLELRNANEQLKKSNEDTLLSNQQLERQNAAIQKMNEVTLAQQKEILNQKEELELKNEKLIKIDATKDKLIALIGHDLRNPVAALSSLVDMLQGTYQILGEKDRKQVVDHIQSSTTSLKLLVNNLLDWSLVQNKHVVPQPGIIEVKKAADECFKLLKLHALGKGIQFENCCAENEFVYADPNMLQTIIRNLVSNAIKFTPRGGNVVIDTVNMNNGELLIIVSDTGMGMTEQKINQLLDNQKLASTSGTSNEKGTGLGLIIVREFILANGGHFDITSTPEEGTRFLIYLPIGKKIGFA